MKNREVFLRDPVVAKLVNDGIADVSEGGSTQEIASLRYELEHFVCEGQYKDGMIRVLETYLGGLSSAAQPAIWVSGFFGSGKSHFLKMLRHLWTDTELPDGARARGLATLPHEIEALFKELDAAGKRYGGRLAAAGKLPTSGGVSLKKTILGLIQKAKGLPAEIVPADFCLWLKKQGIYDQVRSAVEKNGRSFFDELHDLYVSPLIAEALMSADPTFAPDLISARSVIRSRFEDRDEIDHEEFIRRMKLVLSDGGSMPCTLIALDEVQLFIGEDDKLSYDVQLIAESLTKQMESRVLLVGSGQTALSGQIPYLQRLRDRFTLSVDLKDTDIETVIRRVVLAKKPDKKKAVEKALADHAGEIDRHLVGTRIGPLTEDHKHKADDYPILPVRRRFWQKLLQQFVTTQLRTQLRIFHEAAKVSAPNDLGTIVGADFIFDQLQANLLQNSTLIREIDTMIRTQDDGTPDGRLRKRLCGLIFLIHKLSRAGFADSGVRATPEMLADLLIENLTEDGLVLRKKIPVLLEKMVGDVLVKIDDEYHLQTGESREWEAEFKNRVSRLSNEPHFFNSKRAQFFADECNRQSAGLKIQQGASKTPRNLKFYFGQENPDREGNRIPVWIRDGWDESKATVLGDARAAGEDQALVFAFIPRNSPEDLKKAIIEAEAAKAALESKGLPGEGTEAREAYDSIATRQKSSELRRDRLILELVDSALVFKAGGAEVSGLSFGGKVRSAVEDCLERMFPRFGEADDHRWPTVHLRAKAGDPNALKAIDWNESSEKNPLAVEILKSIGPGLRGKDIRDKFEGRPFGWPKDAIDGILMTLHTAGFVRVVHKGAVIAPGQLDQTKIVTSDFRSETVTLDAASRLQLRKLFQDMEISYLPNEEIKAAERALEILAGLASRAGGEPPLPAVPSTEHLDQLRMLPGNQKLIAIHAIRVQLVQEFREWTVRARAVAERVPEWRVLRQLLELSADLSGAEEAIRQAAGLNADRRLLDNPDPVPPLQRRLAEVIRAAVIESFRRYETLFLQLISTLEKSETWNRLDITQKTRLLSTEHLDRPLLPDVGTIPALIECLEAHPLGSWQILADALPLRFARVEQAAAKFLEPKTQIVRVGGATLKTPDDVKRWLVRTEKSLLDKIAKGPIVLE